MSRFTKRATRSASPNDSNVSVSESAWARRIETPLEDSPAYQAGVKPGDLITKVDGKTTLEMTITQAIRAITGEPGTIVVLTIEDPTTTGLDTGLVGR